MVFARSRDGRCGFLAGDGLCRIHKELGIEAKNPHCRAFPFSFVSTPEGKIASISFACPTVARGEGKEISRSAGEIEAISNLPGMEGVAIGGKVPVRKGMLIPWEDYMRIETAIIGDIGEKGIAGGLRAAVCNVDSAAGIGTVEGSSAPGIKAARRVVSHLITPVEGAFTAAKVLFGMGRVGSRDAEGSAGARAIEGALRSPEDETFRGTIEPYILEMIRRKGLIHPLPLATSVRGLVWAVILARWYSALHAAISSRERPNRDDLSRAVMTVETFYFGHQTVLPRLLVSRASSRTASMLRDPSMTVDLLDFILSDGG